jgi:hypothetical protein
MVANGAGNRAVVEPLELTPADIELARTIATLLIDVVPAFGAAVAPHTHAQLRELPKDEDALESTRLAGIGNAMEVLSMLRSGLPPSAHETPVEALAHARYLHSQGVGLTSVIGIYKYGYTMFRNILNTELALRVKDPVQLRRVTQFADDYCFAYISTATGRVAAEFGKTDGGWYPSAQDEVLSNPASAEAARQLREQGIARGTWLAASPELSHARQVTERTLNDFALTVESGAHEHGLSDRLKLADTTINITLADEPDLSVTLLLDRSPIGVVDGIVDAEAHIWIASMDLTRIWSPDFYLSMAITKGRLRVEGPVRKFLRIVPILRVLSGTYLEIVAQSEEVG